MAYQVPAAQQSIGQDKFEFGPETGDEYSVRKAKLLTLGQAESLSANNDAAVTFFGTAGTPQGDYIRSLTLEQFQGLVAAWRTDSGLTAGESQASDS